MSFGYLSYRLWHLRSVVACCQVLFSLVNSWCESIRVLLWCINWRGNICKCKSVSALRIAWLNLTYFQFLISGRLIHFSRLNTIWPWPTCIALTSLAYLANFLAVLDAYQFIEAHRIWFINTCYFDLSLEALGFYAVCLVFDLLVTWCCSQHAHGHIGKNRASVFRSRTVGADHFTVVQCSLYVGKLHTSSLRMHHIIRLSQNLGMINTNASFKTVTTKSKCLLIIPLLGALWFFS